MIGKGAFVAREALTLCTLVLPVLQHPVDVPSRRNKFIRDLTHTQVVSVYACKVLLPKASNRSNLEPSKQRWHT